MDELLTNEPASIQQPETPEKKNDAEISEDNIYDEPEYLSNEAESKTDDTVNEAQTEETSNDEIDEYGNEVEQENAAIRERLARQAKKYESEIEALRQQLAAQGASREVQQAAQDFQYDPADESNWQQQLAQFVKQTVAQMNVEQQQKQHAELERMTQVQFEQKFRDGMERFTDFRETVGRQPIDDAMTLALRGMADPAAFIYAASKRQPEELEKISRMPDPYARMVAMGKLEERMRKQKQSTKAPRPLGKQIEDTTVKETPKKPKGIDDILAEADAKRLQKRRAYARR